MTNEDDRQRLRQRTVQGAKTRDPWRDTHPGMFTPWVGGVLAMESLLTEAEATIATQAAEIEGLVTAEQEEGDVSIVFTGERCHGADLAIRPRMVPTIAGGTVEERTVYARRAAIGARLAEFFALVQVMLLTWPECSYCEGGGSYSLIGVESSWVPCCSCHGTSSGDLSWRNALRRAGWQGPEVSQ